MSQALTAAWCEEVTATLSDLPPGPGGSGIVELVVSGGDPDRVVARWVVEAGRPVSVSVEPGPPAEVTVPMSRAVADGVLSGDLDPAAAFMRGDLKPEGSSRAWFAWLSAMARDDVQELLTA
jgi:putative sterol carrier protein